MQPLLFVSQLVALLQQATMGQGPGHCCGADGTTCTTGAPAFFVAGQLTWRINCHIPSLGTMPARCLTLSCGTGAVCLSSKQPCQVVTQRRTPQPAGPEVRWELSNCCRYLWRTGQHKEYECSGTVSDDGRDGTSLGLDHWYTEYGCGCCRSSTIKPAFCPALYYAASFE